MDRRGFVGARIESSHPLTDDEVRVWRIGIDLPPSELTELRLVLSSDEQERVERFRFEADRRRSVVSRGCLRLLLGALLRLPAFSLRFEYNEFGKPKLISTQEQGLQFNVSHSGDLVLIAITKGRAVGLDVEKIRTDIDLDGVAARFFSTDENRRLASLAGPAKYEAFFTCWTRKEAYLKAHGGGLSVPLDRFDVSFLPNEDAALLATRPDPNEAKRWTLLPISVPSGYAAALASEGTDWRLGCVRTSSRRRRGEF